MSTVYVVYGNQDGVIAGTTSVNAAIKTAIDYNAFAEPDEGLAKLLRHSIREQLKDYTNFIIPVGNADIHVFDN